MRKFLVLLLVPFFALISSFITPPNNPPCCIVIHAGAGGMLRESMTPEEIKACENKLSEALEVGNKVLQNGGKSLDAVEAAINVMENAGIFDAGKGSIFNSDGNIELDASIMQGQDMKAGSVAAVTTIKNPISAAKAVMQQSTHVMLVAKGAEDFARNHGLEMVDPSYFFTEKSHNEWLKIKAKDDSIRKSGRNDISANDRFGTVGVVALDKTGNVAAGTSTGGMMNKKPGRVGDSPIIGAGTFADNNTCAVSCTGTGEYFIRLGVARDIAKMVEYKGYSLGQATSLALEKVKKMGGEGGIIVLDKSGNFVIDFNTIAMNRGYIDKNGKKVIKMFGK